MALITFTSDFGYTDHYVAAVKAKILSTDVAATIVDVTHAIEPFNIAHGVQVVKAVYQDFPEGTVHIVAVDTHGSRHNRFHAIRYKGHYFLAADNGILSLLTEAEPEVVVELQTETPVYAPARDLLAPAATFLAKGGDIEALGDSKTNMHELIHRQLRLNDHFITGHIVHVDHYGNLITNISRDSIDAIGHGRSFSIRFARETVERISPTYNAVEDGDCVCVFNTQNQLCIGINKGNAAELLGLGFDSQVDV
ncbi:MAG: SAM-dependent chlorinase/fluorinase, partial [Hymenobacteraceae bacterium]|nr:SAM-dependent chlorinase/fluorinase [Hymenobacteraceae bacterium]MDX5397520.1 SAM-dependent chlorinase/fluorinase [Hymenobacteraceae bacterium]MDX5513599.1 SAM-dependent chlorinase/fluorinase [Hymenobacteraceae bacterium]